MPPSSPTLHVHYYRPPPSAHNWHLNITPPNSPALHTLPPHPPRTSFGHVFSTPLSTLPASINLQPVHPSLPPDLPRRFTRPSSLTTTHIFLLQSNPTTYASPIQIPHPSLPSYPRFLPLLIPSSLHVDSPPWILVRHSCISTELFPASPRYRSRHFPTLYLLDQAAFKHPTTVSLTLLDSHANALALLPVPPASPPPSTITLPVKHHIAYTLRPDSTWVQSPLPDIRALLIAQVDQLCGAICPTRPAMSPRSIPPLDVPSQSPLGTVLTLHAYRVTNGGGAISVMAFSVSSRKALHVVREARGNGIADIFEVTVGVEDSVSVEMTVQGEKGQWGGRWERKMGTELACVQSFERLLLVGEVERSIMYYRFGDFEDWHEWEMHIWSEGGDGWEGRTAMVKGERPLREGMVRFDMAGLVFPNGAVVKAEMVRMSKLEGRVMVNEFGEEYVGEPYIDASRRDVVREWVSGAGAQEVLHFVQGEHDIRTVGPSVAEMEARRWIRLRYYRHQKGDYDGWDLWTWDESDPDFHRVVCRKVEESEAHTWVEFEVDRANYGAAGRVSVIPRRGGDEWLERDEPIRVWTSDLMEADEPESGLSRKPAPNAPTAIAPELGSYKGGEKGEATGENVLCGRKQPYLIAQCTRSVFRGLWEAKGMLKAYVCSPNSISVVSPIPVRWILSQHDGRPRTIHETELRVCEEPAHHLLARNAGNGRIRGRTLKISKVVEKNLTEYTLVVNESRVTFDEDFLVENVVVSVPGFDRTPLTWETKENWDDYFYEGSLGWEYRKDRCSFRCFAPTADQLHVVLYNSPSGDAGRRVIPMRRIPEGCWKTTVQGNLRGKFYTLLAEGENKRLFPGVEVIDPYSRCNTGHTGRGLIFGNENTKVYPRPDIAPERTIVYELHVRDISIDEASGISRRGKFLGLTERGTRWKKRVREQTAENCSLTDWKQSPMPVPNKEMQTLDKLSSGLDHIVQMGVNTIQILPIQDFDNDESDNESYRWGYMPVHFNSPDGWYASSTSTAARVTEFKKLVDAAHRAGLKVIMDVVYNHTAEDSNEFNLDARFSFNGIAPRYYYRTCGNTPVAHTGDSTCGRREPHEPRCGECYSNGSGCGNEFRSESPMGRKFIIDSLKYWATEYQVDGFRFDLLGLIDVETLERASAELHKIDSNILVYGEPWAGGLSPIRLTEKGMQRSRGFGVFNNTFRDAIRGSPFGAEETFVMDGGRHSEVKGGIIGSIDDFCDKPIETINYVECHDNYTLWDHLRFYIRSRTDDISFSEGDQRRMHRLAAVIVFTSQGIPFMQAGQEMCRTKFDVENSYESPDSINMVRWEAKQSEWATVQYYRGLILLRRSHPEIFCKRTSDEVHNTLVFYEDLGLPLPERCIAYRILGNPSELYQDLLQSKNHQGVEDLQEESRKWSQVVVLLNPTPSEQIFQLPGADQDTIWIEFVDATHSGVRNLRCPIIDHVPVQGRSACLMRKASVKEHNDFRLVQRLAAVTDSYASFHGDDLLSNYAVGLTSNMESGEAAQQANLKAKRENFEKNRTQREDRHLYTPSPSMTEVDALRALDAAYRK
eukprot:GFKZ01008152.1.p1 GENE.GFKZ01008152.1~~GFKZ01008152.1.p1  ORF type:complete len:1583 (+),score=197.74 GFKZ01008152.1:55-4749(+)